jgi:hypothetical protein
LRKKSETQSIVTGGRRVDLVKVGGLFLKMAVAKGYGRMRAVGSEVHGTDQFDLINEPVSNLGHQIAI